MLTNDLLEHGEDDVALVLDDYHVIIADSIQRGMTFLLEHLPPQLHLILATRADSPLPLARLRARGQLTEIRTADLRFGAAEVGSFLREREVLRLLLEGDSNQEIANRLVLSVNTVKRHVYNLCGKLGVQSRARVIVRARDLNLV